MCNLAVACGPVLAAARPRTGNSHHGPKYDDKEHVTQKGSPGSGERHRRHRVGCRAERGDNLGGGHSVGISSRRKAALRGPCALGPCELRLCVGGACVGEPFALAEEGAERLEDGAAFFELSSSGGVVSS
jgi:hypothetical protein